MKSGGDWGCKNNENLKNVAALGFFSAGLRLEFGSVRYKISLQHLANEIWRFSWLVRVTTGFSNRVAEIYFLRSFAVVERSVF